MRSPDLSMVRDANRDDAVPMVLEPLMRRSVQQPVMNCTTTDTKHDHDHELHNSS